MVEPSKNLADLEDALKPFYQRAAEAEERLQKLEAALDNKKVVHSISGNVEHLKTIGELQSQLENAKSDLASEREKAQKLAADNEKLRYRILHLLHAVKEADLKFEQVTAEKQLKTLKLEDP